MRTVFKIFSSVVDSVKVNTTLCTDSSISSKTVFLVFSLCMHLPSYASAQNETKKPGELKRKYTHSCPKGTERVGEGHPETTVVFCKQNLYNGSRMEGDFTKFFRNGNKQVSGTYEQGKKHGTWTSYYRTGEIRETKKYQDGEMIKTSQYKRDGREIKKQESNKNKAAAESKIYSELRDTKKGSQQKRNSPQSLGWPRK